MTHPAATIHIVWPMIALFTVAVSPLRARQVTPDRPSAMVVPVAERLWTVQIAGGDLAPDRDESTRLEGLCGAEPMMSAAARSDWIACRSKNLRSDPHQIATVHAAPSDGSAVVAAIFEERIIFDAGELLAKLTVQPAAKPGVRLPWPESRLAYDYGLHLAGVQHRSGWVRLLSSIPVDGWLQITPEEPTGPLPIYVWVSPLESQVVELRPLTATWPDGTRRQLEAGSYVILKAGADVIEFRAEIPSDFECGNPVTDPVPVPPTLRAPASELFDSDGTPRFATKYTRGC